MSSGQQGNEFTIHIKEMLVELMSSEQYADVTLFTDDQMTFRAHKFVLSACSPVFKEMLGKFQNQNPLLYLKGVEHHELQSLLTFMYKGQATCKQDRMEKFLDVAHTFQLKSLTENFEERKISADIDSEDTSEKGNENIILNPSDELEEHFGSIEVVETEDTSLNKEAVEVKLKDQSPTIDETVTTEATESLCEGAVSDVAKYSFRKNKPKKCPLCNKNFSRPKTMRQHFANVHEGERIPCSICNLQFSTKSSLKKHLLSKHKDSEIDVDEIVNNCRLVYPDPRISCNFCTLKFFTRRLLKKHVFAMHESTQNRSSGEVLGLVDILALAESKSVEIVRDINSKLTIEPSSRSDSDHRKKLCNKPGCFEVFQNIID